MEDVTVFIGGLERVFHVVAQAVGLVSKIFSFEEM